MIIYEFPLNERVRTLLRLDDLFFRIHHFIEGEYSAEHHAALAVLFEILEVASRSDLKSELLQELDRQKRTLTTLHNNPEISENALDGILVEIENTSANLLGMTTGKIGQHLRDNEWLMSIKQRTSIPGGVCEFDLPSYHFWQHQDSETRRKALESWLAPMLPLKQSIVLLLRLLRESGKEYQFTALHGAFQQMQGGRVAQLLRISMRKELPCIPEVSANKYALNIRFIEVSFISAKTVLFDQDIPFDLTFCSL